MYKNKKTEKRRTFISFWNSILFCQGLIFFVLVAEVQAGGRDEPIQPPTLNPQRPANEQPPTLSLDWEQWETPYWSNDNICRENKGNVICLSPEVVRQLRWVIPSQNES
ncbi:MAG: hypothetical protein SW833_20840 [Cyanobacteriota bacterium]|nr:hypothetical protein [Cyanobacteriota bacterium]